MSDLIIRSTRNEVKAITKAFNEETRQSIDRVFAITPEVNEAAQAARKAEMAIQPTLCEAMSKLAADKEGLKKMGFETFQDAAIAIFHFDDSKSSRSAISMYKLAGDRFYNVEKRPAVAEWWPVTWLQELRNIPAERLEADVEAGILSQDMTFSAVRDYGKAVRAEALEAASDASEAEIVPDYDGYLIKGLDTIRFEAWTEDAILHELCDNVLPMEENVHRMKSAEYLVTPPKKEGGEEKRTYLQLLVVEMGDGSIRAAKFSAHKYDTPKGMSRKQYNALRALGLDDEAIRKVASVK